MRSRSRHSPPILVDLVDVSPQGRKQKEMVQFFPPSPFAFFPRTDREELNRARAATPPKSVLAVARPDFSRSCQKRRSVLRFNPLKNLETTQTSQKNHGWKFARTLPRLLCSPARTRLPPASYGAEASGSFGFSTPPNQIFFFRFIYSSIPVSHLSK